MTTVTVHADSTYPVVVAAGARNSVNEHLAGADRVAVIHPPTLRSAAAEVKRGLDARAMTIEIPEGEAAKTAGVLEFCWSALGAAGFTRNDAVVSLGGGATTDLAGFVAASWLRGVRVVHLPTTLLAMVDAAVGGKTGINTAAGKNLVGAFHSPVAVLADLEFLRSLPRPDYAAGLAEVVKAGFIRDPRILQLIESDARGATTPDWPHTEEVIARAIQVKADVVAVDLTEQLASGAGREILNYGHTFGHAIERVESFTWRHGDAVAVGMVYVAELAHLAGRIDSELVGRHHDVLAAIGLPTSYPAGRWEPLLDAMRIDKKSRGSMLRFVVLDGVASPAILEGPDAALLVAAYDRVSES